MTYLQTLHQYNELFTAIENEKDPERLRALKKTMKKLLASQVLLVPVGSDTLQFL